jgi:hypothetical protein
MGKVNVVQNSFAAGELSPRMLSRTDLKGYKEGCQELTNMIPVSHGPALSRPGTYFITTVTGDKSCRLVPFHVAPDEVYMLVFSGANVTVLNESGLPPAASIVVNGRFQQGSLGWTTVTSSGGGGPQGTVNFTSGAVVLDASPNHLAAIRQTITTEVGKEYKIAVTTLNRNNLLVKVGTAAGGTQLVNAAMGTRVVEEWIFTATTTSTFIQLEQAAGSAGTCTIASCQMVPTATPAQLALNLVNPFPSGSLRDIQYEMQPAGKTMYFSHPLVPPQRVVFTPPSSFAIEPVPFGTTAPSDWGAGDYPAGLTFFEGRLWYGGTSSQPSKLWASKSGNFLDFTVGANADDGLAYTIAKAGSIRWIKGMKNLLVGSDNSEFTLSSEGGVITPSDIVIEPQSAYGSLAAAPLQVGNQALYVSSDGRKLRAMGYRFEESGWVSTDLTFASEHITKYGIYSMAWAQNPENVVFIVDLDGQLIGCTYDKSNTIIGWHKHQFTGYDVISVAAARFVGTDRVWLALWDRTTQQTQICAMTSLAVDDIYTDVSLRRDWVPATSVVTGLGHLEGKTVQVLANGAVHPDRVVTGGQITLQSPASTTVVGVGYTRTLKTMPIEFSDNEGATEVKHKKVTKVYVRVLSSLRPLINGVRPPTRFPATPMDTRDPAESTDIQVLNFGWNMREAITIQETLPIPMSVVSVFAEMATS